MENIVLMPGASNVRREVGQYVRLGETGHKILEDLVAESRFPARRVVVDASRHKQQSTLIEALQSTDDGVELVLDTKCAELAAAGKFDGAVKDAPWSHLGDGQPIGKDLFPVGRHSEVLQQIADFAVEHGYSAVLGTGHLLREGAASDWLKHDIEACYKLVELLSDLGAPHIGVDYSLIVPHTLLSNHDECARIIDRLKDVPFENLWIRAAGFGSDAAPLTTQRYIRAMPQFHRLGKPIIADYLGGIVGLACAAFGSVSGLSHGIDERQRFDIGTWDARASSGKGDFRRAVRVSIPGVQTSMTLREIDQLGRTPAGRRLVACSDRDCCENGLKTMIENPRRHWIRRTANLFNRMGQVPLEHRPRDFLEGMLSNELRTSRELARLKPRDEKLESRLTNNNKKMNKLFSALDKLATERENSALRPCQVPHRSTKARRVGSSRA